MMMRKRKQRIRNGILERQDRKKKKRKSKRNRMMSGLARKKQLKLKVQQKLQIFNLNSNLSRKLNPNLLPHQLLNNLKGHGVKVSASLSLQIQLPLLIIQIIQIQHQEENNPNLYSKALQKKTIKNQQKEKVGENDNFTFFRSLSKFHNF
jgi:hypothetical protein